MVFGDIHELLRKVNGESEPAYMWQSDKPKEKIKEEAPSKAPEQPCKDSGKKLSKAPKRKAEGETDKRAGENKPSGKGIVPPSKRDLQSMIEAFSYGNEHGHRHMVFLPDDVYATLETVYGSNRISAILTALARTYIERNKEELRQLVATRINLLQ